MKKLLLIASAVLLSFAFATAQSDTTRNKNRIKKPSATSMNRMDSSSQWYKSYPTKDMIKVKTSDIPSTLRTTLQGSEYGGWETGTLYQNSTTKEYSLQLPRSGAGASNNKNNGWHRFDPQGKMVPDQRQP